MGSIIPGVDLPNIILVFVGCAIIASFVLGRTILGRYIYRHRQQRGGGTPLRRDARSAGRPRPTSSAASSPASPAWSSRRASTRPSRPSASATSSTPSRPPCIGGTSLSGGEGTIFGTFIGAFVISVLTNGLRLLSVPQEWQIVVTGCIVVLAVYLDIVRRRRQG